MGHGLIKVYSQQLTSGVTTPTTGVDLGRAYASVYLQIPTMPSGSLQIKASADDVTYFNVFNGAVNTATVATFIINSAVTNAIVPIPPGFRYYKVQNISACTDVVCTFKFICADEL